MAFFMRQGVLFLLVFGSSSVVTGMSLFLEVQERGTYLRTNADINALAATRLPLATLPFPAGAGERVHLRRVGDWENGISLVDVVMIGVFSSTQTLTASSNVHRVPGSLSLNLPFVTEQTFFGSLPTDIPEDFMIAASVADGISIASARVSGVTVTVPHGAQHLFIAPHDSFYGDNLDSDNDYALEISSGTLDESASVWIGSRETFLRPNTAADIASNGAVAEPIAIELSSDLPFGIQPGDWLRMKAVGAFQFADQIQPPAIPGPYGDGSLREAFGVFSGSGTVVPLTSPIENVPVSRVPGAIDIAAPFANEAFGGSENDIPEDFWIWSASSPSSSGFLVQVPPGATHLILGAADTQWFDNTDDDNDYGIQITKLYSGRFVGDYNFDGHVDAADYTVWRDSLGAAGIDLQSDGNLDGAVTEDDYVIWRNNFGATVGTSLASSIVVPEPTAVAMVALALTSSLYCRRR